MSSERRFQSDRGATLVEYALGVALIVVVSLGAIDRIEDSGTSRLDSSDDRISDEIDGQYYAALGTTTTVGSPTTTTSAGSVPVHLDTNPQVVIENQSPSEWRVTVTFTVVDSSNVGVIGATMSGTWTDGGQQATPGTNCNTSTGDGECTIQFLGIKDNISSVTFTLTSISGGDFFWQPEGVDEGTVVVACQPDLDASCD